MSKKTNSMLFILIATIVNIVITLVCMLLLLLLYARLICPHLPPESAAWGIPVIFICAIVISFLIYRAGIKFFSKKIDMEKNFDPLFCGRKQQNKKDNE
jgi:Na+-driven multidrug efflux pump